MKFEPKVLARRYAVTAVVITAILVAANLIPPAGTTSNSAVTATYTPAPQPGSAGTTASGVHCGPDIRQVPWSHYAPICEPKWTGKNNGGATSPGVTKTTITLTYRSATSAEMSTLYSLVPKAAIGTNAEAIATMQAYINTFNKSFELYGRKVVLKPYTAKGDFILELNGQDTQGAIEDAVTAKTNGAFADASALSSTPQYETQLAREHIIGLSIFGGPTGTFKSHAPYMYSTSSVCGRSVEETEQLVQRVLSKTPVAFSPQYTGQKRTFGMVENSTPATDACNQVLQKDLSAVGVKVTPVISIQLSATSMADQVQTAAARLKSSGVTTVLCASCDFFMPIELTKAATNQGYFPEWVENDFLTALTALQTSRQLADAIGFGRPAANVASTEAEKAFAMGTPPTGSAPIPSAPYIYGPVLLFFDALQAAGPDLTPATFAKGLASLPTSKAGGMFGKWSFGSTTFDPVSSFGVVKWSGSATNPIDGNPGAWLACNKGREYAFTGHRDRLQKTLSCPSS